MRISRFCVCPSGRGAVPYPFNFCVCPSGRGAVPYPFNFSVCPSGRVAVPYPFNFCVCPSGRGAVPYPFNFCVCPSGRGAVPYPLPHQPADDGVLQEGRRGGVRALLLPAPALRGERTLCANNIMENIEII